MDDKPRRFLLRAVGIASLISFSGCITENPPQKDTIQNTSNESQSPINQNTSEESITAQSDSDNNTSNSE